MSQEEYKATEIDINKGIDEFAEVERLIQETLAETKALNKPTAAPVSHPIEKPTPIPTAKTSAPLTTPAAAAPSPKPDAYASTFKEYKPGDIVKGKIIKIDTSGILVDINYKSDGLIELTELSERNFNAPTDVVKVGEIIDVYISNLENKAGYVVLSKIRADYDKRWKAINTAFKNKELLEGKVLQVLRGGLIIDCHDIRGFVPASQMDLKPGQTLESFKDKTIGVKIIEFHQNQSKVVFSHKAAAGEKEKLDSVKIFNQIEPGQVRKGIVANLKSFGAFVDLGGVEGLIHLSELSWKRVKHPSEVLKSGQEIEVLVLGVDKLSRKISLGYKELLADPWASATEYYKPGQVVKVKVARFAKFGAFCELDHGLEGLIHNSELSKEMVNDPSQAIMPDGLPLKIGDEVEAKILRIIPDEQKIGLSIKEITIEKERQNLKEAIVEQPKVTIGDIIAQKEKDRQEREEEVEDENVEENALEEETPDLEEEMPGPQESAV